jgi:murein DD-endopeptidase MepM/ murein hydrolase activator NlpD
MAIRAMCLFLAAAATAVANPCVAGAPPVELRLDGEPVQGGLLIGHTRPGTRVAAQGRPLRVADDGAFLVGINRDETDPIELVLTSAAGEELKQTISITRREYRIQRIDGLPPKKVTPPAAEMERIRREGALVAQARTRDDPRTDFEAGFIWPATGPISGVYGSQRILNGKPRRPHFGVDIAVPTGTPVVAPAPGIVTLAHPDMYFSGGTLFVDHGHGLTSYFMHLSRILVSDGDRVEQGDVIAESGATGRATGAHLHWGMNLFNKRLDPQRLVPPMPDAGKPAGT